DGDRAFLVCDYEYLVTGDRDDGAAGARLVQRLGPLRLGGTFASEFRSGGTSPAGWLLAGADAKLDLGRVGSLVGELAWSHGTHRGVRFRLHLDHRWIDVFQEDPSGALQGSPIGTRRRLDAGGDLAYRGGPFELRIGARTERLDGAGASAHRTTIAARVGVD